jgi:hypothetical protein
MNAAVDATSAKALVSFSTHEAHAAWKTEDAIFEDRLIKVFWHLPMELQDLAGQRALGVSRPLRRLSPPPQSRHSSRAYPPCSHAVRGPQGRTPAPTAKNAEPSPTSSSGEQPSSQSPLNRVCKAEARCIALAAWHGHHSALAPGQLHAWCPRCRLLSFLIARRHYIVSFPIYT